MEEERKSRCINQYIICNLKVRREGEGRGARFVAVVILREGSMKHPLLIIVIY